MSVQTRNRLAANIAAGVDHISLSDVTGFPWDSVLIFPPYSDRDFVSREIGYFFPIQNQDEGYALLVFTRKSLVITWIKAPRMACGDFAYIPRSNSNRYRFSKDEAVFTVDYRGAERDPVMQLDKKANKALQAIGDKSPQPER